MPGRLDLAISHVDFATLETQYFPFQPPVRMTLQPAATVRICLTLPDGQPAPGFKLILEGIPNGAHSSICRSGDTDNAGICTFTGLPVGNHTIRYHGGAAEPLAVPAIRIAGLGKGEFREIARQAVPGCIICGRVLNADSKLPVEHAEVRFQNREYPRTASTFQAAYTNTNGSFEFRYAVAPGVYDIAVTTTYQGERIGHGYSLNVERQPRIDQTFFLELPAVRTSDS
jgi:hypothetical protein